MAGAVNAGEKDAVADEPVTCMAEPADDPELVEFREWRRKWRELVARQLAVIGYRDAAEFERLLSDGRLFRRTGASVGWVVMDYAALPSLGEERSAAFLVDGERGFVWANAATGVGVSDHADLFEETFELPPSAVEALKAFLALEGPCFHDVPSDVYDGGPTVMRIRLTSGGSAMVKCNVATAGSDATLSLARLLWRQLGAAPRGSCAWRGEPGGVEMVHPGQGEAPPGSKS